jgi:hypothetical protein
MTENQMLSTTLLRLPCRTLATRKLTSACAAGRSRRHGHEKRCVQQVDQEGLA